MALGGFSVGSLTTSIANCVSALISSPERCHRGIAVLTRNYYCLVALLLTMWYGRHLCRCRRLRAWAGRGLGCSRFHAWCSVMMVAPASSTSSNCQMRSLGHPVVECRAPVASLCSSRTITASASGAGSR